MGESQILILADDREPPSMLDELRRIAERHRIHVIERRLEFGDYWLVPGNGTLVVERKSVNDFVSSMTSGRLMGQVREILGRGFKGALLLEGFLNADRYGHVKLFGVGSTAVPYTAAHDLLLTLQHAGVMLMLSPSPTLTPKILVDAARWAAKEEHESLYAFHKIDAILPDTGVLLLTAFPGVGIERARTALRRARSLKAIFNGSEKDLQKWFGKKTGSRVWRIINSLDHEPD